jgi:hypothetical protein
MVPIYFVLNAMLVRAMAIGNPDGEFRASGSVRYCFSPNLDKLPDEG